MTACFAVEADFDEGPRSLVEESSGVRDPAGYLNEKPWRESVDCVCVCMSI